MTMRIAVFNHRLLALGGGERLALNIAQALAGAGHAVDFLHCDATTPDEVQQRLNLSLDGIRLRRVSKLHAEISAASQEYDVFINSAHGQFVQPQAKRSVLLCFFPVGVDVSVSGRRRWRVGNALRPLRPSVACVFCGAVGWVAQPRRNCSGAMRIRSVWSITQYTQHWVRHYWQRESALLYPLVEPMKALAQNKQHHQRGPFSGGPQQQEARGAGACFS